MALKSNFYNEIFANEQKWIEQINKNLLNSIYCDLVLKPFYEKKRQELIEEYNLTKNKILEQIISTINIIIYQINTFKERYNNSQKTDLSALLPLFLTNQMNNNTFTNNSLNNDTKNEKKVEEFDYIYDDFPEEVKRVK